MSQITDVQLKDYLDTNINTNYNREITGEVHNYWGTDIIDSKLNKIDAELLYLRLDGTNSPMQGDVDWGDNEITNLAGIHMSITPPDHLHETGRMHWDEFDGTLAIDVGFDSVTLQVGQELHIIVYNGTGSQLNNASVCYPVGGFMGRPSVALAKADYHTTCAGNVVILTMDIPDGEFGIATQFGKVRGADTSAFNLGDTVYLSDSVAGGLTSVPPEFPSYLFQMGGITVVDPVDGEVIVESNGVVADTTINFFNGIIRENFDFFITTDGITVTGSLTRTDGGDVGLIFSDGITLMPTSIAPETVVMPLGTSNELQESFVFIPKSTKLLTVATSGYPTEEHIRVADCGLFDATRTLAEGAQVNRNWNDHIQGSHGNGGQSHIGWKLRQSHADWSSGCDGQIVIDAVATPDDVWFSCAAGKVYQKHEQTFPAQDMETGSDMHIVNWFGDPYHTISNLNEITQDALGNTVSNRHFNVVFWGVQNKTGSNCHIMGNLPVGTYGLSAEASAIVDVNSYSVYSIPPVYKGKGFLIGEATFFYKNNEWTLKDYRSLLGAYPTSGGGVTGGGSGGVSVWTQLGDTPDAYDGFAGYSVVVGAGEAGLDFLEIVGDTWQVKYDAGDIAGYLPNKIVAGTGMNFSSVVDGTYGKQLQISTIPQIQLELNDDVDLDATGITFELIALTNLAFGDVCYIDSTGKAVLGKADALATASTTVICIEPSGIIASNNGLFLHLGMIRDDSWNWTIGEMVYLSTTGTTGNTITQTIPSGTTDYVIQILGVASTADTILFNPSLSQVTLI